MIVLQASHVQKSFGDNVVLADITMAVREKERVGLVGTNGAGKSTLLKILAGLTSPDAGEIIKPSGFTLGYLAQDSGLDSDRTVWEEMIEAFRPILDMAKELRQLEHNLSTPEAMSRYDLLSEEFRRQGGYSYRADTARVLKGLNFQDGQFDLPINTLSGGQKTRLALARLLLLKPGLLILDEPTNYLDLETLFWLEQYLKSYPGSVLVVSHDRYFLDQVAGIIYELENGRVTRYPGNYSRFMDLKSENIHQMERAYKRQREEIARQEEFVRRNIARATTASRARSRLKALEKIIPLEKPAIGKTASFSFGIERQSGTEVLKAKDLSIGYPGAALAQKLTFSISRGETVALVGPNGIGKTTLLKTIAGIIAPLAGHFLLGTNVSIGYYRQEQAAAWSTKQALYEIWDCFPEMDEKDVRSVLGSFLIRGDAVYKTMDELSGGERARVSLARLMLQKPNLLLLDEPTNHLDIYSKEVLEETLVDFPGTILLVSHDRYFLNKTAGRILELNTGGLLDFPGSYQYYLEKKQQMEQELDAGSGNDNKPGRQAGENRNNYELQKEEKRRQEKIQRRIEKIEADIAEAEKQAETLEKEMQQPEVYQDVELLMNKNSRLEELKSSLEKYYNEWMELNENNV
ncbi:ABC transporter [Desulfocucumis palustris]|uniref:ABC transporter n=1 Tax=Desulfocucumis palustris TaxID=1898651 RepID=A0A2L2XA08_9FIRM|nr:ABC-F family ATP-binding cassette domain-containing protein [Desulfocucumis palustris]GBF32900.1 ABC transporter [Desulfocucumis palustris]